MSYFSVFEISYVIAATIGILHYHAGSRQRMMVMKVAACVFAGYYFWGVGAETAMLACGIAGLGGFMQAVCPDHMLQKTKTLRSAIAIALASMAIVMAAGSSLEALPLVATICSRFSEVQSCQQRIRMGWLISQICWISYAAMSGLILIYITEHLNVLSNLYAIWRHEQQEKKLVLIPVRVT